MSGAENVLFEILAKLYIPAGLQVPESPGETQTIEALVAF